MYTVHPVCCLSSKPEFCSNKMPDFFHNTLTKNTCCFYNKMVTEILLFEIGALDQRRLTLSADGHVLFMGSPRAAVVKITITGVYNRLTVSSTG
jgi:hypothetical protein